MKTTQFDQTSHSVEQWEQTWQETLKTHFEEARSRVDLIHARYFSSPKAVCLRHWRNKKDVPQDLLNLPIGLWEIARSTASSAQKGLQKIRHTAPRAPQEDSENRKIKAPVMNRKERQLLHTLENELFDLPNLQLKAWNHLRQHPELTESPNWPLLLKLLRPYSDQESQARLSEGLKHLAITHEGARDLLLFIGLGIIGKSTGHSLIGSGAMTLGASAASSIYIGQQSWLAGLWFKWAGTPVWVTSAGAATGMGLALLVTPLIAPLSEIAINKWKGKQHLHKLINITEEQIRLKKDGATLAGHAGTFAQLLPDLLQTLKQLS